MPQLHTAHHTPEALARVSMVIEDAIRAAGPQPPDKLRAIVCRPASMVDAAIERCIQLGELRALRCGRIVIVRTGTIPRARRQRAATAAPATESGRRVTSSDIYRVVVAAGTAGATTAEIRRELEAPAGAISPRIEDLIKAGLIRSLGERPARFVAVLDLDDAERAAIRSLKPGARRMLLSADREPLRPADPYAERCAARLHARGLLDASPAGWVLSELGRIVLPVVAAAEEAAR